MTIEDVLATQSRVDVAHWLERGLRMQLHEQMQKGHDMRKPSERFAVAQEVMKQEKYWRVTPDRPAEPQSQEDPDEAATDIHA